MSTIVGFIVGVVVGSFGLFTVSAIMINRDLDEFKDVHEEDNE